MIIMKWDTHRTRGKCSESQNTNFCLLCSVLIFIYEKLSDVRPTFPPQQSSKSRFFMVSRAWKNENQIIIHQPSDFELYCAGEEGPISLNSFSKREIRTGLSKQNHKFGDSGTFTPFFPLYTSDNLDVERTCTERGENYEWDEVWMWVLSISLDSLHTHTQTVLASIHPFHRGKCYRILMTDDDWNNEVGLCDVGLITTWPLHPLSHLLWLLGICQTLLVVLRCRFLVRVSWVLSWGLLGMCPLFYPRKQLPPCWPV